MKKSTVFVLGFLSGIATLITTVIAAVVVFCCPAANPSLVNALLFRPSKEFDDFGGREIMGIVAKDVTIPTSDPAVTLFGRLYEQKDSPQVMLYNHGQGGNISMPYYHYKVNTLLTTGASVLVYDYRGFGKSTGSPTIDGVIADARAAYDYLLKNTKYKSDQIIVYGESLGTGISTELASSVKCGGIVLESGYVSVEKIGKELIELMQIYPSSMFPKQFDNLKLVASANHPPILIIAGKLDRLIPCHHSQYLFDHSTKPTQLAIFEKSTHGYFASEQPQFDQRLRAFLNECAGSQYAKL